MRNRSFFVSNIVMFFVGIVLFATTQLIPQLTQDLFGYDATNAGLTLSPGGVFVLFMMPIAGFLVSRVQPKYLIMFGFFTTGCALWYWTNLDLRASFRDLVFCRVIQAGGLAFLFVPINTIAYSGLPPGASNDASALINLMRNYGGSVGVSIVQTMVARRSQFHQARLVETITNVNPVFYQQTHGPMHRTVGNIYADIGAQAEMLSFLDIFKVLSILSFIGVFVAAVPQADGARREGRGRPLTATPTADPSRHRCRVGGRGGATATRGRRRRPARSARSGRPRVEIPDRLRPGTGANVRHQRPGPGRRRRGPRARSPRTE